MGSFVAEEAVVLLVMLVTAVAAGASVVEEETLAAKETGSVWETANAFEASATTSAVYAPVDGGCMIALEELWARIDDRPDCRKAIATRQGDCPVSGALVDECAAVSSVPRRFVQFSLLRGVGTSSSGRSFVSFVLQDVCFLNVVFRSISFFVQIYTSEEVLTVVDNRSCLCFCHRVVFRSVW